jgi:DNA modification methylase
LRSEFKFCEEGRDGGREADDVCDGEREGGGTVAAAECGLSEGEGIMSEAEFGMLTILQGDALEKLRTMPDESVQCCVTSPPYWGLRDYGIPPSVWPVAASEGVVQCNRGEHLWEVESVATEIGRGNWSQAVNGRGENQGPIEQFREPIRSSIERGFCKLCGAWKGCLGLEPSPDLFVRHIVEVFREVRRVLKNDGTLWLNLGDTYSSGGRETQVRDTFRDAASGKQDYLNGTAVRAATPPGLKPKDLCGIPWRVAFALHADGWYLRSDIIWYKPNPMPESVTDRPTKTHEYLFLLSKSERYYYDAEAIQEKSVDEPGTSRGGSLSRSVLVDRSIDAFVSHLNHMGAPAISSGFRNKRSVWTVATAPYSEAHFATFPPDLIKPCILAGSRAGDTILDPFAGSGTTGMVTIELGRKAVLIELNPAYILLIEQRCCITPGFAF